MNKELEAWLVGAVVCFFVCLEWSLKVDDMSLLNLLSELFAKPTRCIISGQQMAMPWVLVGHNCVS